MKRIAEKEMLAAGMDDDVYMRDYIENIDEILR